MIVFEIELGFILLVLFFSSLVLKTEFNMGRLFLMGKISRWLWLRLRSKSYGSDTMIKG